MENEWKERDSAPDAHAVVHHVSLDEEFASSSIKEVEQPLLSSVRSVMPDVATAVTRLLIEVLFTIPGSVLHLWHTKTLSVDESDVLGVSEFVVCESSSYESNAQRLVQMVKTCEIVDKFTQLKPSPANV